MATIDELIQKLKSDDENERALAAQQLGKRRSVCVTEPLIETLRNDPSLMVRKTAAQALGENGDRRALQPLLDALDESKPSLRESAIRALGLLGDTRAIQPLIHELQNGSEERLRARAAIALSFIGDPRAVEPIANALLNDPETNVRERAAIALVSIPHR